MGPRQCLAVAWAVWTIKPTLNRNDEGPDSSGLFLCWSHSRSGRSTSFGIVRSLFSCLRSSSPSATVHVPARFHKLQDSRCYLWADATQAPVGRDRTDGRHLEMWGCCAPCVRGSPSHANPHNQMVLAQGLGHKDRSTSGNEARGRRRGTATGSRRTEFRWTKQREQSKERRPNGEIKSCERRSKNASGCRSKNISVMLAKEAAELSFLSLRKNRVPVILISFRNRFLALAPAIAGG